MTVLKRKTSEEGRQKFKYNNHLVLNTKVQWNCCSVELNSRTMLKQNNIKWRLTVHNFLSIIMSSYLKISNCFLQNKHVLTVCKNICYCAIVFIINNVWSKVINNVDYHALYNVNKNLLQFKIQQSQQVDN